jgi:hypothetical protein
LGATAARERERERERERMASMLQRVASSGVVPASCALLGDSTRSEYGFSLPQNLAAPHGSSSWSLKEKLGLRWGDSLGFRPLPSSFFSAVHPSFERTQQPSRIPLIISMVLPTGYVCMCRRAANFSFLFPFFNSRLAPPILPPCSFFFIDCNKSFLRFCVLLTLIQVSSPS